jgi:hypothetical protein
VGVVCCCLCCVWVFVVVFGVCWLCFCGCSGVCVWCVLFGVCGLGGGWWFVVVGVCVCVWVCVCCCGVGLLVFVVVGGMFLFGGV